MLDSAEKKLLKGLALESKKDESRGRSWCFTSYDTRDYKLWQKLDLIGSGIRYIVFQLEKTPTTGRVHIQGYVEFYDKYRKKGVKKRLRSNGIHLDPRNGPRARARDYCMKEESPWWQTNYPEWMDHGCRIHGTQVVELGTWATRQGFRTDLVLVGDMIKQGASASEIFDAAPREYLKYSQHIKNAINMVRSKKLNYRLPNFSVEVWFGTTGAGKTSGVFKKYGEENVYTPKWNGTKWWFPDYDDQKVLLINEFTGAQDQAGLAKLQNLLDIYQQRLETKGGFTVSNWSTVIITSNVSPEFWWDSYCKYTEEQQESILRRISAIRYFKPRLDIKKKTWASITVHAHSNEVVELVLPQPLLDQNGPEKILLFNKLWDTLGADTRREGESVRAFASKNSPLLPFKKLPDK